jgi:hypothetical protein
MCRTKIDSRRDGGDLPGRWRVGRLRAASKRGGRNSVIAASEKKVTPGASYSVTTKELGVGWLPIRPMRNKPFTGSHSMSNDTADSGWMDEHDPDLQPALTCDVDTYREVLGKAAWALRTLRRRRRC